MLVNGVEYRDPEEVLDGAYPLVPTDTNIPAEEVVCGLFILCYSAQSGTTTGVR